MNELGDASVLDECSTWDFLGIETDRSIASQCLANEKRRKRQPKNGEKRRAKQASAVRPYRGKTYKQDPWNAPCEMKLFLCESVRAILPEGSDYR